MAVNKTSATLSIPTMTTKSGYLPIVRLFSSLDFWLMWRSPAKSGIVSDEQMDQALTDYQQAFTQGKKLERRIDWTSDAEVAQLDGFMAWLMQASVGGVEQST